MSDNPFSNEALKKAVDAAEQAPTDQVQLGVTATKSDIGAEVEGEKELGKGWFTGFDAQWWKQAGWKAAGVIGWRKKDQ